MADWLSMRSGTGKEDGCCKSVSRPSLAACAPSNAKLQISTNKVNSHAIKKPFVHGIVLGKLLPGFPLPLRKSWLVVHQYIQ